MTRDFAGPAGEQIRGLLSLSGLRGLGLDLLGVLLAVGLGLGVAAYLVRLPLHGQIAMALVCLGPALGRPALFARHGAPPPFGECLWFGLRFAPVTALWAVPLGWLSLRMPWPTGGWLNAGVWPSVAAAGAVLATAAAMLAVTTAHASASDSLGDALSPRLWRWTLRRAPDCVLALILGVGTGLVVGTPLAAVLLLAGHGVAHRHAFLGVVLALLGYACPPGLALIALARVVGRLAVLRSADEEVRAPRGKPVTHPLELSGPAPPAGLASVRAVKLSGDTPGADAMAFIHAFQSLGAEAERDLDRALARGERLAAENPRSAGVHAELCKLYRRAGNADAARGTAARAIALALEGGTSPVAVDVLTWFWEERGALRLEPAVWMQLGKVLRARGRDREAEECEALAKRDPPPS